jgi:uncharacterized protein involved in tellurium resistance
MHDKQDWQLIAYIIIYSYWYDSFPPLSSTKGKEKIVAVTEKKIVVSHFA